MKTNEILSIINGNGGFCNLNNWKYKEKTEWVQSHFKCSLYVAKKVALYI